MLVHGYLDTNALLEPVVGRLAPVRDGLLGSNLYWRIVPALLRPRGEEIAHVPVQHWAPRSRPELIAR